MITYNTSQLNNYSYDYYKKSKKFTNPCSSAIKLRHMIADCIEIESYNYQAN